MQIFLDLISDGKGLKEDRTGGRKGKRDRTRRGLRKGNGGDTGRNDEHKEVIVTKRNQFFYQKQHALHSLTISFYRVRRKKFRWIDASR